MGDGPLIRINGKVVDSDCERIASDASDGFFPAPNEVLMCEVKVGYTERLRISSYQKKPPRYLLFDSQRLLPSSCFRFSQGHFLLDWDQRWDCLPPATIQQSDLLILDSLAKQELSKAFDFTQLDQQYPNRIEQLTLQCPQFMEIFKKILQLPEVECEAPLILTTLYQETRFHISTLNGAGLGQFDNYTWGIVTSSEQFQQAWKRLFGEPPPTVPGPGDSVIADILAIAMRYSRIGIQGGIPLTATPSSKNIMAARFLYAQPKEIKTAQKILIKGETAVNDPNFRWRLRNFAAKEAQFANWWAEIPKN